MQRIARGFRFTQPDLTKRSGLIWLSSVSRCGQSVAASVVSDDLNVKQVGKRVPKDKLDLANGIGLIRGSDVSRCGHSVASSVVSNDSKIKKVGKILPRDERRGMVESYVIKFKEMNGGKFPTASETRKQVGGSYYVIKNILQEIKHGAKAPPTRTMQKDALREEKACVNKATTNIAPVLTKTLPQKVDSTKTKVDDDEVDLRFSNHKSVGLEQKLNTSILSKKTLTEQVEKLKSTDCSSGYIGTLKHESKEEPEKMVGHLIVEKTEHDKRERSPSESQHSQKQHGTPSPELDKLATGNSEEQSVNEELPGKTSLWGNLKSLAHGIIKIWRG